MQIIFSSAFADTCFLPATSLSWVSWQPRPWDLCPESRPLLLQVLAGRREQPTLGAPLNLSTFLQSRRLLCSNGGLDNCCVPGPTRCVKVTIVLLIQS